MKQIRILLFAVMLVLVMPAGYASISDSTTYYYNRSQVDSIVAAEVQRQLGTAVKSEVAKQVDTELIDLKIDKSTHEKLIALQNTHDSWLVGISAVLVALGGILIPYLVDKDRKKKMKNLETRLRTNIKRMDAIAAKADESSRHAEFSVELSRAMTSSTIDYAIKLLSNIISQYNSTDYVFYAYNCRGNRYCEKLDYDKAIQDYSKAIELNPDFWVAYNNLGLLYKKQGNYSKAIDTYTRIIMKNPDDAEAFLNRGKSYKSNGEYDNAMKDAKKSLEIATRSGDATLIERINKTIKEIEETRTPQAKATTN